MKCWLSKMSNIVLKRGGRYRARTLALRWVSHTLPQFKV